MNIDLLGMHYKVHILEFLKTHNRLPIIKKYIYALYGEDGTKIFLNENVVEMHQIFSPYGMLVAPDIMKAVSQKIKWNVVGYTGYKEYAMQGPSDCFELLTSMNPSLWKSYGHSLYWQSEYASLSNNTSPYCWRDENGNIVLRFERIASPIREAMHEKYYRQPILFRWLCNSEWLKETLCKHNLHLRYVSRLESIP